MLIVAGHLIVDPSEREAYLADCASIVEAGRQAPGCLDFSISADLVTPGRINIFEHWECRADVEAFRGNGPGDVQAATINSASVADYVVGDVRPLT